MKPLHFALAIGVLLISPALGLAQDPRQYLDVTDLGDGDWHLKIENGEVTVVPIVVMTPGDVPTDPTDPDDPDDPDEPDITMKQFRKAVREASQGLPADQIDDVASLIRAIIQQDFDRASTITTSVDGTVGVLTSGSEEWQEWIDVVNGAVLVAGYSTVSEVKAAYSAVADVLEEN